MKIIKFPGEPVEALFSAQTDVHVFEGVAVYRCVGTEVQIRETTDTLSQLYPTDRMETMGDAQWIGKLRLEPDQPTLVDLYELIVFRKVSASESAPYS